MAHLVDLAWSTERFASKDVDRRLQSFAEATSFDIGHALAVLYRENTMIRKAGLVSQRLGRDPAIYTERLHRLVRCLIAHATDRGTLSFVMPRLNSYRPAA